MTGLVAGYTARPAAKGSTYLAAFIYVSTSVALTTSTCCRFHHWLLLGEIVPKPSPSIREVRNGEGQGKSGNEKRKRQRLSNAG